MLAPSPHRTRSRLPEVALSRSLGPLFLLCAVLSGCGKRADSHPEHERRFPPAPSALASSKPAQPTVAETRDPPLLRSLSLVDGHGNAMNVACVTCHSLAPLATLKEQNVAVHGQRALSHGTLSCKSCHDQNVPNRLTLAGGDTALMTEALTLCAQCHGPQYRDYRRGSHGGMRGYWDRSVGPRERKHCVECHDPHSPAFQPMNPVPPPHGSGQEKH